jgi:hypothetical protein
LICSGGSGELLDQAAGDGRGQDGIPGGRHPHAGGQLADGRVLEEETARARTQRLEDVLIKIERGEYQHPRAGHAARHLAGRLDPVEIRHADVHQHHVRSQAGAEANGLPAGGGLTDHLEIGFGLQDQAEAGADQLLVIGYQHTNHSKASSQAVRSSRRRQATSPALVLMAVALWRSRNLPWWIAILLPVTYELAAFAPAGPIAVPLMLPFLVISVVIARGIWSQDPGIQTPAPSQMTAVSR